jgi:hypothetical protein
MLRIWMSEQFVNHFGNGYTRIHLASCREVGSLDETAVHAMTEVARFDCLDAAVNDAKSSSKSDRWQTCTRCIGEKRTPDAP